VLLVVACPSSVSAFESAPSELAVNVDVLAKSVGELDSLAAVARRVAGSFDEREEEVESERRKRVVGKVLLD